MAKKRDRAIAWFFAIIFIASVLIFSVAVIYTMITGDDQAQTTQNNQNNQEASVDPSKQLQGKPLENFAPVAKIENLEKQDIKPGEGKEVQAGDTVTVDYTGAVASTGVVFQSSKDSGQPISFPLSGVIAGWSQGVPGMKEGGTRRLLIPANLAYGANPPAGSGIPANADLVFDITLHKIGQ